MIIFLLATLSSAFAWTCSSVDVYVDVAANNTLGQLHNGSSSATAYSNVQDAAEQVAAIIADWNDSSTSPQITVNIAEGTYYMSTLLFLTGAHSGVPDCPTVWKAAGDVTLSGGVQIQNWTQVAGGGMWSARVPEYSETRALYVDGVSAPRARSPSIPQNETTFTYGSFASNATWLDVANISSPDRAELRFIGTFTDRYMPIDYVASETFIMKQPAWYRNLIGYDTISEEIKIGLYLGEQGLFIENSLSFLDEDGEWYLDVPSNTLYYQPVEGKDPNESYIVLPQLEVLLSLGGLSYDEPAHDIQFINITFAHSGWNYPTSKYGYPDQQTGAYIGEQYNRTTFEAYRPFWQQTPGAVQISAAERVSFSGGGVSCTAAASMGIGNDDNACYSNIGLGAKNISVTGMTFTQSGGNVIQVGGIQSTAHHPYLDQMINSGISISNNYLHDNARIYTSATNILFTYVQYSSMVSNTVENTTYSALSQGWGWGSNDPGASPQYKGRGLYQFQPIYYTPTTEHNNYIAKNYIFNIGANHTDEGGIYTLSSSPGTVIEENAIIKSRAIGLYFDEGSRYYFATNNVIEAGSWYYENTQNNDTTRTGNNTFLHNYVNMNASLNAAPSDGSHFINNIFFNDSQPYPAAVQAIIDAAGASSAV